MAGRPVCGSIRRSKIVSIGQAPGPHEERLGKPFAYTAGRTLFKWMASIGISEDRYRQRVNMSAVCRCYPGKAKGTGDRVPTASEIHNCSRYLEFELTWHKPSLVIPIGKLAIQQLLGKSVTLASTVGTPHRIAAYGVEFDCICLPHPSGLNAWNNMEPGRTLIRRALAELQRHPVVQAELIL